MRIGLMIEGQEGLTWQRWFRLADAAEGLGYEALVRSDHLTSLGGDPRRPALDTWTSLAALAARTRRIRFGPLVSPLTFYHPALLARMAAAVDDLAGGRLDLGIGAGWNGPEHAMFGVPFPPLRERLDRLEYGARLIRALEGGGPATLAQPSFPLVEAQLRPSPPRGRFRLVVGGQGEKRTLRVVAEVADEWNVTRVSPDQYAAKRRALADHCAALGRDPATIARSLMVPLAIGRGPTEVARRIAAARSVFPALPADEPAWHAQSFLAGAPERVLEHLHRWEAVGVERVLLQTLDQDDIEALELFARHVLPRCGPGAP